MVKTKVKKKVIDYHNRKPDKETEMFRSWKLNKNEVDKDYAKDSVKINYKGMELSICGFTTMMENNKKKELVFAYKFKHEDKVIIYYEPEKTSKTKEIIEMISSMATLFGYRLQDMKETLESVYQEYKKEIDNDK